MRELEKRPVIRLGIGGEAPAGLRELEKTCEKRGWRVETVVCPRKRLGGLLRSGTVDLIPADSLSDPAESVGFFRIPPGFLTWSSVIERELAAGIRSLQ